MGVCSEPMACLSPFQESRVYFSARLLRQSNPGCPVEGAKMSSPFPDPTYYYQSYVNPKPALTLEQFRLIQQSWQRVKDGQFEAFHALQGLADPLGLWGLQLYDTLFELHPALKVMFPNTFTQSQMLTEMMSAA